MAYNDGKSFNKPYNRGYNDGNQQSGNRGYNNGGRPYNNYDKPRATQKREFPEDYVEEAEKKIQEYTTKVNRRSWITTTKLRNILSLLMDVYNVEKLRVDQTISEESHVKLQMARIRLAYECGRDRITKDFVDHTNLLPWLKNAGKSREKVLNYIHYVEALVAYHRYYGGKE